MLPGERSGDFSSLVRAPDIVMTTWRCPEHGQQRSIVMRRDGDSEGNGLFFHGRAKLWLETAAANQIHLLLEQFLDGLLEIDAVEEAGVRRQIHQKIHIAAGSCFIPGNRSKNRQIGASVGHDQLPELRSQGSDFREVKPQEAVAPT